MTKNSKSITLNLTKIRTLTDSETAKVVGGTGPRITTGNVDA